LSELQLERDTFLFRSYIAQRKYRVVIDEISGSSPPELRPLKTLADYFANKGKRLILLLNLNDFCFVKLNAAYFHYYYISGMQLYLPLMNKLAQAVTL
jgi:hypothetical protein